MAEPPPDPPPRPLSAPQRGKGYGKDPMRRQPSSASRVQATIHKGGPPSSSWSGWRPSAR
eukprot:16452346-Heterocapsa_arctica.AAC.4